MALAVLVTAGTACLPVKPPGPQPPPPPPSEYCHPYTPKTPGQYQLAFEGLRRFNTAYFVAADGGIPIRLSGSRILWLFGDTVVGRWTPGGPVDPFRGLANNSFVLQRGNCFKPTIEPIADPASNQWVWPTGAVVENGVLRVIGMHMKKTGPGPLDFALVNVVVTTCSLSSLNCQGRQDLPPPKSPDYGLTLFLNPNDNKIYAYGRIQTSPDFPAFHHYVARVPVGQLLNANAWEYWHDEDVDPLLADGIGEFRTNSVTPSSQADPMFFNNKDPASPMPTVDQGPGAGFPVARTGPNSYLGSALGVDFVADADLLTWHATLPEGPWIEDATRAFNVPANGSGMRTYGGRVVLGLPNGPLALWSQNHDSFDAVLANPNIYRVEFRAPDPNSLNP